MTWSRRSASDLYPRTTFTHRSVRTFCIIGLAPKIASMKWMATSVFMIIIGMSAGCSPKAVSSAPAGEPASLSGTIQLTSGFDRAGEAYFSPDMKWIVFQAVPKGEKNYQMYVAKTKWAVERLIGTESPTRISPEGSRNTCGFFSPDGKSLIFASTAGQEDPLEPTSGYQRQGGSYRWDFPAGMEIYRADGWEAAVKKAGPGGSFNLAQHRITENKAYDAECAYSPDGKWIVYTSNQTGDLELWATTPDGKDRCRLTNTPGYDGGPFVSPDGKKVVYRSDRNGNDLLQIFVSDVVCDAGGKITGLKNEKQLTSDGNVNWGPYWHPDNLHIIYASSAQGHTNYELYLMRADGSHNTRITFTEGFDGLPVFSLDGQWLMWSSKRSGTTQVWAARFRFPPGS
jgi:TolB protein